VVRVDLEVAARPHREVEAAVPAELADHVVEERHAGVGADLAGAVEVELDPDVGLLGRALDQGCRRAGCSCGVDLSDGVRKALVSGSVPALTRSQPARPGPVLTSRTRTPRSSSACQVRAGSANGPNSRKLASVGTTCRPRARSSATIRSRCALTCSTVPSSSSACASAVRAAAWVSALRWYGSRTSRSASTTAGLAAR
jgi:hypothetical protein